jgi:amino acid adenylation domain-containing protein
MAARPRAPELPMPFPLSFEQRRLWFQQQLSPESPAYNVSVNVGLTGPLNIAALERTLHELLRRHEMLRAGFSVVDGEPVQFVSPDARLTVRLEDLSTMSVGERKAEVQRLAAAQSVEPFDLGRPPLIRVALLLNVENSVRNNVATNVKKDEHVLLVTAHHLVCDGASAVVLLREMGSLYDAFVNGKPSALPKLSMSYFDYVRSQSAPAQQDAAATDLSYWRSRLADAPAVLRLPFDRSVDQQKAAGSARGGMCTFELPGSLSAALKAVGQRHRATLFMTFLAAFQELLHRYSGQDDVCVGTPILTRSLPGTEALVGCLMNTLVMRTNLSGDPVFRELLERVRDITLEAFAHPAAPFDSIVEALRPERNLEQSTVFQVMLVVRNMGLQGLKMGDLTVTTLGWAAGAAVFDLLLVVEPGDRLRVTLEYNADRFEPATAARLLEHFRTLLEAIVEDAGRHLSELPLLSKAERRQVLVDWNATAVDLGEPRCLHELFEAEVHRAPNAIAVTSEEGRLTYRELERRANQLANRLRSQGVGQGSVVAICADPSLDAVAAVLGSLKAGAAFVPLDPTDPKARLASLLRDVRPQVVISQARVLESLPFPRAAIIALDVDRHVIAGEPTDKPTVAVTPDDVAYVIFTSGSTGQPKGVMVPHRAICNQVRWRHMAFPLMRADVVLQSTALTFDPSVWEMFGPLCAGASSTLLTVGGRQDVAYLAKLMAERGVTTLQVVPSVLEALLDEPGFSACTSLRQVFCGGEALTVNLQQRFFARSRAALHHLYGPTETAIEATSYTCRHESRSGGRKVPIGRPIANVRAYVVDARLQLVPVGIAGELLIGGAGLAIGYLNLPDLTAERFIFSRFGDTPQERLYRTGDLARFLPDGNLEFLGRLDEQVKVRGVRIEPGEIEAVMATHPAIREAAIAVQSSQYGGLRVVAYVVTEAREGELETAGVRHFLKERLPAFMVPRSFMFLPRLPRLPSGKIDRRALPVPDHARADVEQGRQAPRDHVELQLARIWEDLLKYRPIGMTDDFFELGGHSLLAARLVCRIEQAFGHALPLSSVFEHSTLEQLADRIRACTTVESAVQH